MQVLTVIPARLESTRLPRKLLLADTGQSLLSYTVKTLMHIADVIVAYDDDAMLDGIPDSTIDETSQIRTEMDHACGSDRAAEVALKLCEGYDAIAVIQADEPELSRAAYHALEAALTACPTADMATLASECDGGTRVVTDGSGRAVYFSRQPLAGSMHHVGAYIYHPEFLMRFAMCNRSRLEVAEGLEQLRALEMGAHIQVARVHHPYRGIDTRGDYDKFVAREQERGNHDSVDQQTLGQDSKSLVE